MMRLLYYSSPAFADCDFPLIKALQQAGIDVTYLIPLSPNNKSTTLFDIKKVEDVYGIVKAEEYSELRVYSNYIDFDNVYILNDPVGKTSWRNYRALDRFIRKGNFDVIHITGHFSMLNCFLYRYGKQMVRTVHDPFPHSEAINFRNKFFRELCFRFVKKLILMNDRYVEKFSYFYKLPSNRIFTNRLGVYENIRDFAPSYVTKCKHNILFFGRITPYKGIENIMLAMEKVKQAIPDVTLTIAGRGKMYMDKSLYEDKDYIKIMNHFISLEELATLLGRCEISVCPYNEATQSGVIMTSYSLCKPVVAFNVGALGEQIEDGKTGILVKPGDIEALADAIIDLFQNEDRISIMCHNIKMQYYSGEKSWSAIAEKYIEIYNAKVK